MADLDKLLGQYDAPYRPQAELKPGPEPTGYDKVFDSVYGWLGGTPDKRSVAEQLTKLFDLSTLGMATGAYGGGREVAETGRPAALAMALMPGAKVPGMAAKGVSAAARELPMDAASKLARARELGFDTDQTWYHGTTHNFDQFKKGVGNPEGHLGKSTYLTSHPDDASSNYAGLGPDLTNRIESAAEEIMQRKGWDDHGWGTPEYEDAFARAKEMARAKIGGPHDGAVIPLYARRDKILDLTDDGTWLNFSPKYDAQGEFVADSPLMERLHKSLTKQSDKYHGLDVGRIMEDIAEHTYDDVRAADLDKALRASEGLLYAEGDTGGLAGNEILRQLYQDMGYRGAVIDANAAFPNMKLPDGTRHLMMFHPKDMRSVNAAFDPEQAKSANLLASHMAPFIAGAGAVGLGAQSLDDILEGNRKPE